MGSHRVPPPPSPRSAPVAVGTGLYRPIFGVSLLIWLLDVVVLAVGLTGWCYSHFVLDGELKAPTAFASILTLLFCVALPTWQNPVGRRVLVAGLFAFFSVSFMAICSAVAWYRNPKHAGHLPDVLHEAVPYVEDISVPLSQYFTASGKPIVVGGLELAEGMMSGVVLITAGWTLTQKWRWLVLRRACVVYGALALLRSVTILVTAVPDASPRCTGTTPGTFVLSELPWRAALARGLAIIVGHLSDPCRSAGDMVFSGHSMVLVLCGMVWHAYYRTKPGTFTINPVKFTIWMAVLAALFLIVVARLHYTLDVVLAVYFAITIFNAYHRVADDVLVGHRFVAVWVFDGLIIYPVVEWIEAPHLGEAQAAGMVTNIDLLPLTAAAAARPAGSPTPRSTSGKSPQTLSGTSVGVSTAGGQHMGHMGHMGHHIGGRGVALSGGTPSALGLGALDELPPAFGVGVRHLPQNLLDAAAMAFSSWGSSGSSSTGSSSAQSGAGGSSSGGAGGAWAGSSGRVSGRASDATPSGSMSPLPSPHAPLPLPLRLPSSAALAAPAAAAAASNVVETAAGFNASAGGAGPGSLAVDASLPQPAHECSCETRIVELEPVLGPGDDGSVDVGADVDAAAAASSGSEGRKTLSAGVSSSSPSKSAAGSPAKDGDGSPDSSNGSGSGISGSVAGSATASGVAPHSAERGSGLRRRRAGSVSAVLTLTGAPPGGQARPSAVAPGCCRFCGGRLAGSASGTGVAGLGAGSSSSTADGAAGAGARAGVAGASAEGGAGTAGRGGVSDGRARQGQQQRGPYAYVQGYQGYPQQQQGPLLLAIPRATFGAGDFLGRRIHWLVRPASESEEGLDGPDSSDGDDNGGNDGGNVGSAAAEDGDAGADAAVRGAEGGGAAGDAKLPRPAVSTSADASTSPMPAPA